MPRLAVPGRTGAQQRLARSPHPGSDRRDRGARGFASVRVSRASSRSPRRLRALARLHAQTARPRLLPRWSQRRATSRHTRAARAASPRRWATASSCPCRGAPPLRKSRATTPDALARVPRPLRRDAPSSCRSCRAPSRRSATSWSAAGHDGSEDPVASVEQLRNVPVGDVVHAIAHERSVGGTWGPAGGSWASSTWRSEAQSCHQRLV